MKPDGTQLTVIVPSTRHHRTIGIVGDQNNTQATLQIVPVLSDVDFTSIAYGGTSASALRAPGSWKE